MAALSITNGRPGDSDNKRSNTPLLSPSLSSVQGGGEGRGEDTAIELSAITFKTRLF